MQVINQSKERGDTLIEVLFAITIFSLVAVGGISIMNQGTATSQRALEITLVRQEVDAQAEALRFLNSSYITAYQSGGTYDPTTPAGQWAVISSAAATDSASDFGSITTCPSAASSLRKDSFIINTRNAKYEKLTPSNFELAQTFSQVRYDNASGQISHADGIWIEPVKFVPPSGSQSNAGYIDFNIRACWDSLGQSVPVTIGTIVRLYEPRG